MSTNVENELEKLERQIHRLINDVTALLLRVEMLEMERNARRQAEKSQPANVRGVSSDLY